MLLGWVVLMLILVLLALDIIKYGWKEALVSSFGVFSVFFTLSYPVKYLFIIHGVEYQAPNTPDEFHLDVALVISTCFWLLVYVTKNRPIVSRTQNAPGCSFQHKYVNGYERKRQWKLSSQGILLFLVAVSAFSFYKLLGQPGFMLKLAFEGNTQNELRVGAGHLFVLYNLYFFSFLTALFLNKRLPSATRFIFIGLVAFASLMEMTLLGTRRPLYLLAYALILFLVVGEKRNTTMALSMLAIYPIVTALLAPLGQVLRYSFQSVLVGEVPELFDLDFVLVSIGSTFEGVEHLAAFFERSSAMQLFLGVDQGVSWIFNFGLSQIPRLIWSSKPLLHGSVAQQAFLYPEMYQSGYAQTTLPPGCVVDSLFGFGLIGVFIMGIVYARVFSFLDKILFLGRTKSGYSLLISATIYINLFNLVRGGTAIISMVAVLLVVAYLINLIDRISWKKWQV